MAENLRSCITATNNKNTTQSWQDAHKDSAQTTTKTTFDKNCLLKTWSMTGKPYNKTDNDMTHDVAIPHEKHLIVLTESSVAPMEHSFIHSWHVHRGGLRPHAKKGIYAQNGSEKASMPITGAKRHLCP
eukprot:1502732-Amphidinium_carterae.1